MSVSATTNGIRPGVCLSTAKPSNPFIGQVIYMSDTDETAVWEGTNWEGLNRSRDRNVVINGAMQVAQRGTSTASIAANGYFTADRYRAFFQGTAAGTWTQSIENDAPTGSGFRKSLKMLCTTAKTPLDTSSVLDIHQAIEGQNLQQFLKGTASAKQFSLTFWVKSNITGTYVASLADLDNSRTVSAQYTISASATWEKKTITFPADTTGAFDNDNNGSLRLQFYLVAGTQFSSGTLASTWQTTTNANVAVGQTNVAAATNNYWQITGVQLEAGSVATPFEFEDIGTTITKCQRYFCKSFNLSQTPAQNDSTANQLLPAPLIEGSTGTSVAVFFPTRMRATPSITTFNPFAANDRWRRANSGTDLVMTIVSGNETSFHASQTTDATATRIHAHWTAAIEL